MEPNISTELASLSRLDDRLLSTPNEKLSELLGKALPALIRMVNQELLRPTIFKMLSSVMKRVKTLPDCNLPLLELLKLVRREHLPFAANFSTTFIDIVWERQRGKDAALTAVLFESILDWPLHSAQSNALLTYTWQVIEYFPSAIGLLKQDGPDSATSRVEELKHILSDYFLDACLIYAPVVKRGGAGSVQPGLSDPRVLRLTAKREELRAKEDLQGLKLSVLELLLDDCVFLPWAAIAISTVLAYDPNDVVAQAATYKMNAQASRRDIKGTDATACNQLISHLLFLSSPASAPLPSVQCAAPATPTTTSPYSYARSTFRDEIRSHLVRWVAKEMGSRVVGVSRGAMKVFVDSTFTDHATHRFRATAVLIGHLLAEHLDEKTLTPLVPLFLLGAERTLQTYVTRASDYDTADGRVTRETCYAIVERISERAPLMAIRNAGAVATFFRLLDNEDESLIPKLYSALGALREAYQSRQQHALEHEQADEGEGSAESASDAMGAVSAAAQVAVAQSTQAARSSQTLQEVIVSARSSESPKKRLAALQWSRAVFDWDRIALETMVILADDSKIIVSDAVAKEFRDLRENMSAERAALLAEIAIASLPRSALVRTQSLGDGKPRLIARFEVFRVLSGHLAIGVRSLLGIAEGESHPLVGEKCWTSIIHLPASEESAHDCYDSLIDLLAEDVVSTASSSQLKSKLVEEASLLLRNILLSGNYPGRRVRARKLDKLLFAWLRECDSEVTQTSQNIADIFGILCIDSLDTFLESTRTSLEAAVQSVLGSSSDAPTSGGLPRRRALEQQQAHAMRCLSTILEACEARLHVKAYNSLVGECQATAVLLFKILHEVLKPERLASSSLRVAAMESYSKVLRHEVFVNRMLAHTIALNETDQPSVTPLSGQHTSSVSIQEKIFFMVQGALSLPSSSVGAQSTVTASGIRTGGAPNAYSTGAIRLPGDQASSSLAAASGGSAANENAGQASKEQDSLLASGITALCNYCTWSMGAPSEASMKQDFVNRVWGLLLSRRMWQAESPVVRFALAEGLWRLCVEHTSEEPRSSEIPVGALLGSDLQLLQPYAGPRAIEGATEVENYHLPITLIAADDGFSADIPSAVQTLLSIIDGVVIESHDGSAAVREKGTAAVLLLIFVRHYICISKMWSSSTVGMQDGTPAQVKDAGGHPDTMPFGLVIRVVDVLLRVMNDSQAFTQDTACMGLCHLHSMAHLVQGTHPTSGKSALDIVSSEVISTLSREKREAAPPGMTHDRSSTQSAVPSAGTSGAMNAGAAAADANANANASRDALAAAAARAAAELGINFDERQRAEVNRAGGAVADAAASRQLPAWRLRDVNPGNYGVYSTAIKVARKSGDASIVFGVLSLIRRDPSFGATASETELLYSRYKPPIARVDRSRIKLLLPMLLLAKYDPYLSVREVMKRLWDILVTPEYLLLIVPLQSKILQFLCENLTSAVWRDREAACSALEMFLVQRKWGTLRSRVQQLWLNGMTVLDDVRDSTRIAALGYVKVLSDQVLRACDPAESPRECVLECAEIMLPILMDRGLVAPTPEGRGVALGVLVRIIKKARGLLEKWLPALVSVLVEAMSAMEPQTLQYMSFHTARLNISAEELEQTRMQLAQHSPMQEALDGCLQSLSIANLPEVVFVLCEQLSRGVGLTTRAAAAQSLSYLAEKYPGELGVNAERAFSEVVALLLNAPGMATSLRNSLFAAIGALGKVISRGALETTCRRLIKAYNNLSRDNRDDSAAIISACLQQIINRCSSQLVDQDIWTAIMACVYVGLFDTEARSRDTWASVWSETLSQSGAGNKLTALRRTIRLVLGTISQYVKDLSWSRRLHGLAILEDVCNTLPGDQLSPVVGLVLRDVLLLLPGKIWSGQGKALEIISLLVSKCEDSLNSASPRDVVLASVPRAATTIPADLSQTLASGTSFTTILSLNDVLVWKRPVDGAESAAAADGSSASVAGDAAAVDTDALLSSAHRWSVSLRGLLALLIHEAGRGDRAYRLEAVAALAALPWSRTCASDALGAVVFAEHVPLLAAAVGVMEFIPPALTEILLAREREKDIKSVPASVRASAQEQLRAKTRPTTYKKDTSSLSLFGGRYAEGASAGASAVSIGEGTKRKFTETRTSAAPSGASAMEDEVVLHSLLTRGAIYGIGAPLGTSLGRSRQASSSDSAEKDLSVSASSLMARSQLDEDFAIRETASEVLDAALSDAMVLEEDILPLETETETVLDLPSSPLFGTSGISEENHLSPPPPPPAAAAAAALGDDTEEGFFIAGLKIPISNSSDSAFRVKLMECLTAGWPVGLQPAAESVVSARDCFISWSRQTITSDVWAQRKAVLGLLRSVISDTSYIAPSSALDSVISTLSSGSSDRNSKVRVAAFLCLESVLKVQCRTRGASILGKDSVELVRTMLRAAATDTEPAVLQAGAKLQTEWLLVTAK